MPKIHKSDCPLRIIVSSKNSRYIRWPHFYTIVSIAKPSSQSINNFQLVEKLSDTYIDEHFKLIFLDVVSFFMKVSVNLAIDNIIRR